MINLTIDGKKVQTDSNATILEAAAKAGIYIPTLCYWENVSDAGACRVCVVEIKGCERLAAACNTPVSEGMEVITDSERVINARKTNVQLILSAYNCHCDECRRNGNCSLQKLACSLGIKEIPFEKKIQEFRWNGSPVLIRDASKCIKCMRCVNVCENIQGLGVWKVSGSGSHTKIIADGTLDEAGCSLCGQCITHCPVDALYERDDTDRTKAAFADSGKTVVMQIAPAVRAAWGEDLGLSPEEATVGRMVAAAKAVGADYVFDTNFGADLTIMEEASELLERISSGDKKRLPMFTSCCPGWVRFVKAHHPELLGNLSTAKSPHQMFGAIAKSYFAEKIGVKPEDICCISVMPCIAKKYECDVPEINSVSDSDVDIVLTTREFAQMIKDSNINAGSLEEEDFDSPLGEGTGAAVIFGATGGVMEAALRTAYYLAEGKNPDPDSFTAVRACGNTGMRTAEYTIGGITLRGAVASGLGEAEKICRLVASGKSELDFIEIMACPGGCAGGGGQPLRDGEEPACERGSKLYGLDSKNSIRFSHKNPEINALYREYLGKPLSEKAHRLLHTKQGEWS